MGVVRCGDGEERVVGVITVARDAAMWDVMCE